MIIDAKDIFHYHLLFRNVFKELLRPDKTPISEFEILMIINENKGIKVGELSSLISITRPNLTPLVEHLEQKELISKIKDDKDKRITRLEITSKGKKQLLANFKEIDSRLEFLKSKYTELELIELKECCESLKSLIK